MPPQMMKRWFGGGPQTDEEIIQLFKPELEQIGQGNLKNWEQDLEGKLATIILCDQLSRNIFRGLAEAFSFDHISLRISKDIIFHVETFKQYKLFEKLFIVMPLLHSENIDDCQLGTDVLSQIITHLSLKGEQDLVKLFELNKRWGLEHLEILKEFGRYPHRNKVLGRENTEEEDMYLRDAGSFGQHMSYVNIYFF